jgi:hypothetical protein
MPTRQVTIQGVMTWEEPRPDNSLPTPPPVAGHWPLPTPPPVAGWGPGFPTPPMAPGGQPPVAGWGPGFPTNPIAPGGPVGPPD